MVHHFVPIAASHVTSGDGAALRVVQHDATLQSDSHNAAPLVRGPLETPQARVQGQLLIVARRREQAVVIQRDTPSGSGYRSGQSSDQMLRLSAT